MPGVHASKKYHDYCYQLMQKYWGIEMVRLQRRARQIAIIKAARNIAEAKITSTNTGSMKAG